MQTAHQTEPVESSVVPPRRTRLSLVLPPLVAVATAGLIFFTAWPTIRPVSVVPVAQAVFDRSGSPQADAAPGDRADRGVTVQAPGWLEAEPFYTACTTLVDGVVERIEVLEGDRVEAGQVVARLVSEDAELRLARARADHASALAEVAIARAERDAARTDWDEPVERERAVRANRAALAESEAEFAMLPSEIESATATLVRLEEESTRIERSRQSGAATEFESIAARQRAAAQRADIESLRTRGRVLGARIERFRAELEAAERNLELRIEERRRLDAAEAMLRRAEADALRAEAMLGEATLELERTVIRAPIDGVVQRRFKVPGDKVMLAMDDPHSAHILHLYDPGRIQVRVDVPLADAANVRVGQACEVVVEVLPDERFRGEVLRITHEADLQKNTLQVKVAVRDPSPWLRPEMLTRVRFLPQGDASPPPTGAMSLVLVPSGAIVDRDAGSAVWAVRDRRGDRGRVRPIPVEVIERNGEWAIVRGGVQPGELIALRSSGLSEGEAVRMARADGGGS